MLADLAQGIASFFSVVSVATALLGLIAGIIVGALPGLTATMTVAVLTPFTFFMETAIALPFLLGVYKGAIYSGSIPAILINTPGTAAAAATMMDGHALAQQGRARHALEMSLYGSVIGDMPPAFSDVPEWRLAVVLGIDDKEATLGLQPDRTVSGEVDAARETGSLPLEQMKWAKKGLRKAGDLLSPGDVVYVEAIADTTGVWTLRQPPAVQGALVAMDPYTGRVLAMVGGFSFAESEFNRATQAYRQPGSSFKPFVYSAALDNGYTPSSVIMDAPIEIRAGGENWRPQNYGREFYGPSTLRLGIEKSRNVMTVRLAKDMGMPLIAEYAHRFGLYDNMQPVLSMSLGAGETTALRMATAYGIIANGGRKVTPTLIDRIQDRYGRTIYKHDERKCEGCDAKAWLNQDEPRLIDEREQVLDPMTAFQITSMMEGVVTRGTAPVVRKVGKPIAGKTGTTNDYKDAWFVGFSPDLVVAVYVGYDQPKSMGRSSTGGHLAAPIFTEFMTAALADQPAKQFQVPPGINLIAIDRRTGLRASAETDGPTIMEAFKPGTEPPSSYSIIGVQDAMGRPLTVSPDADRYVGGGGTGGLY